MSQHHTPRDVHAKRYPVRRFPFQRLLSFAVLSSLLVLSCGICRAEQDRTAEYKGKFERETDPIRKAKVFISLGNAQVSTFVRAASAEKFDDAFTTLNEYRGEVRATFDGLKGSGIDPERKPDGFKELQIHLRKTLWEMDRTMPLIPIERRTAFQDIRAELSRIHSELIHMLFPREPGSKRGGEKLEE